MPRLAACQESVKARGRREKEDVGVQASEVMGGERGFGTQRAWSRG